MARKKTKSLYGAVHIKKRPRKRPGRHTKRVNKHSKRKRYRGQGR